MEMKKATLIVHSGGFDKILSAFIVGNGYLSMGFSVTLFFTFWELNAFLKNGFRKAPLSRMNLFGLGRYMIKRRMKKSNVASLNDLAKSFKEIGGGYQEFDLRGGTENVAGIASFGRACELYSERDRDRVRELRDYLYDRLLSGIDGIHLNGSSDFNKRLSNNLNVSFDYIEGESVVLHLDMRGVAVITGSACFSRSLQASHVLLSMGFSHERAHGSIRFSPSRYTSKEDIDYTVFHTGEVVEKLRDLSPLARQHENTRAGSM